MQALLSETRVITPDLPIAPAKVLAMLRELVEVEHPDIVIRTSMGGVFVQQLILVNPAGQLQGRVFATLSQRATFDGEHRLRYENTRDVIVLLYKTDRIRRLSDLIIRYKTN